MGGIVLTANLELPNSWDGSLYSDSGNLLSNGLFETDLTGWTTDYATRVTTKACFGSASMENTQTTGQITALTANLAGFAASVGHLAQAWVWVPVGCTINMVLQEFTAADGFVGQTATVHAGAAQWTQIQAVRTYGATGAKAMLYFTNASGTTPATYWVDGVRLI